MAPTPIEAVAPALRGTSILNAIAAKKEIKVAIQHAASKDMQEAMNVMSAHGVRFLKWNSVNGNRVLPVLYYNRREVDYTVFKKARKKTDGTKKEKEEAKQLAEADLKDRNLLWWCLAERNGHVRAQQGKNKGKFLFQGIKMGVNPLLACIYCGSQDHRVASCQHLPSKDALSAKKSGSKRKFDLVDGHNAPDTEGESGASTGAGANLVRKIRITLKLKSTTPPVDSFEKDTPAEAAVAHIPKKIRITFTGATLKKLNRPLAATATKTA